jgi:Ca2+-binding RTX toxin-like protein
VNGSGLRAGENFTLNGSAESNGSFLIYGGKGVDNLTLGGLGDTIIFGVDGRFGAGDTVNGGGGYDVVYLRGDYSIDFNAVGFAGSLSNVESVGLLGFANPNYAGGGDGEFDYSIVWNNAMLATGQVITFNGSSLGANETLQFDGTAETDGGRFRLWGGAAADVLRGGSGNDLIYGGNSGDTLQGGAGADIFRYQSTTESNSGGQDGIQDFALGDLIDLSFIDADTGTAGNQTFTFIGSGAFTNQAGQLRAVGTSPGLWTVQGDTNGDNNADFVVAVVVTDAHLLGVSDFVL